MAEKRFDFVDASQFRLGVDELYGRVLEIIKAQEVPVSLEVRNVAWHVLPEETRPRLVARLQDHLFNDYFFIGGVDYMGRWASLHLTCARELPVVKAPPPPPMREHHGSSGTVGVVVGSFGVLVLMLSIGSMAGNSPGQGAGAVCGGLVGAGIAFLGFVMYQSEQRNAEAARIAAEAQWRIERDQQLHQYLAKVREERLKADAKYLLRSFPGEDMKLFCAAMEAVFQRVVHDIESRGVTVTRVLSSNPEFFGGESVARRSSAASAGV